MSRAAYLALLAAFGVLRLFELRRSRGNTRRALAAGAVEEGAGHYPWMVALHTAFLVSAALEVWLFEPPFRPRLAAAMLALLAAAVATRWWAISTLGDRWTTRVICFPGRPAIRRGPYRWLRHPNYVAVAVELLALPLVHGAYRTAVVFSLLNFWLLAVRIGAEEAALARYSAYDEVFRVGVADEAER